VKTQSGLGYKSSQVQVQQNGLNSGFESNSGLEYYKSVNFQDKTWLFLLLRTYNDWNEYWILNGVFHIKFLIAQATLVESWLIFGNMVRCGMWDICFIRQRVRLSLLLDKIHPCQYQLVLNVNPVSWINRVKYIGVHLAVIRAVVNEQTSIGNSMVSLIVACRY